MRMTGLSIPLICSVVLVFHTLFAPVLPSVTPDFNIELQDGGSGDNLAYKIVPSNHHPSRLKRQVIIASSPSPPEDMTQPTADKTLLIKNPAGSNEKKPTDVSKSRVPITVQPQDINPSTNSNSLPTTLHDINAQLDNAAATNGNVSEDTSEPFSDEDVLFDGNSTYPHLPINNTYYQNQQNVTIKKIDAYRFYTVNHDSDGVRKYWVDMQGNHMAKKHDMLSNAHRRAATVKPNFPILFYGHSIANLTVATGGFIYLGDQVHAWLAATQYVAPLMANFDSSTSLNATVNYVSESDYFTVEWNQVRLHDSPNVGPFTFQTTLFKNGTIVFVYKEIPIPVSSINDTSHPVKVGLSDAYIKDKNMLFVRQKTIYEYDRIDLKTHPNATITNGTAIIFVPFATCLELKSCEECTFADFTTPFKCAWCPTTNRCSNGTDRYYQDWTQAGCDKPNGNFTTLAQCAASKHDTSSTYNVSPDHDDHDIHDEHGHGPDEKKSPSSSSVDSYVRKVKAPESEGMSAAGVIGVMFTLMLIFGAVGWLAYAYYFPHSPSGQLLIRYRPTQWSLRRGEARYTAASIHM